MFENLNQSGLTRPSASGGQSARALTGSCGTSGDTPNNAPSAPPNDDFTNAQRLEGASGSVIGTLTGATVQQSGSYPETDPESNSIDGYGYGAEPTRTVWYCWTAPADGWYEFDTIGSPSPFAGDGNYNGTADPPVLSAWKGRNWNATDPSDPDYLRTGNAVPEMGTNQEVLNWQNKYSGTYGQPGFFTYTQIQFNAQAGAQYLIYVENCTACPTPDEGDFRLNWGSLLAHYVPELRFAQDELYRPSNAALATNTYSTDPPAHANQLKRDTYVLASANPSELVNGMPVDDLSLVYLGNDQVEGDYIDLPTFALTAELSAALDYVSMLSRYPGLYNNQIYGRIVADAASGDKLLQYWFYYYYNPKTFYGVVGEHEGDWEWIQVRLSRSGRPTAAAYSQHGNGEKCSWQYVEKSSGTHPVVWPALGSHANYFSSGTYPVEFPGFDGEDTTAPPVGYDPLTPTLIDQTVPEGWIEWRGYWGASTGIPIPGDPGHSPKSPGWQSAWAAFSWEATQVRGCRATSPLQRTSSRESGLTKRIPPASAVDAQLPRLPKFTARLSRDRTRVIVNYCFASMPRSLHLRPWLLTVGVDNRRDKLPALSAGWRVKTQCGLIRQPVGPIKPPYTLLIRVTAFAGDRSRLLRVGLN
ncbi:MAG: Vps62-related protein [Actinomycetota bacterium]|nr:Vps62-related protein [Actinomycetota bacterium]